MLSWNNIHHIQKNKTETRKHFITHGPPCVRYYFEQNVERFFIQITIQEQNF